MHAIAIQNSFEKGCSKIPLLLLFLTACCAKARLTVTRLSKQNTMLKLCMALEQINVWFLAPCMAIHWFLSLVVLWFGYISHSSTQIKFGGAGIAQWLEHRIHDWKVAGSNPCWNGGRIFFSRVDFLCWLLFQYPFHPRVTTVARKKSQSFCQKCRWQVTAKHAYTLCMWILLNRASALVTTCP